MSLKDTFIGLIIIFIWGFNFVVIAWGVESMPPLLMGGLRFLLVALLGSLFIAKPNIPWRWMALYALTLCFGQFSLLFSALAFGMPAGLASLVLQSQAVFTLLFSLFMLKEQIKNMPNAVLENKKGSLFVLFQGKKEVSSKDIYECLNSLFSKTFH